MFASCQIALLPTLTKAIPQLPKAFEKSPEKNWIWDTLVIHTIHIAYGKPRISRLPGFSVTSTTNDVSHQVNLEVRIHQHTGQQSNFCLKSLWYPWNCDILKLWQIVIMRFCNSDILKLWHFEITTLWNCDILKLWHFEIMTFLILTFF